MILDSSEEPHTTIERLTTETDIEGSSFLDNHNLIYILKGEATFSYGYQNTGKTTDGKLIFLPIGSRVNYSVRKDSQLLVFRLKERMQLFECANPVHIDCEISDGSNRSVLRASEPIRMYMKDVDFYLKIGANDHYYLDLKLQELLFLLGMFYTKEELAVFLGEAIYKETAFTAFVWTHYQLYNTVIEFADAMNYTVSGFVKRFKKVFGVSPYKWMKEQKAKLIYQDVCFGAYSFKQIADKYNFSSTSTFNDFYKLTFGETPGATRRKMQQRNTLRKLG